MEAEENRKKPQFGTRYLTDPDKVFLHNAWDDVEWNDDLTKEAEEKIKSNSECIVPVDKQEKYESEANLFWDKFYNIHQNRFFKDRHWLFTEFPELCIQPSIEKNESTLKSTIKESPSTPVCKTVHIWEVGCGVGNTVFPILETNIDSDVFVYCCDFSEVAISIIKLNSTYKSQETYKKYPNYIGNVMLFLRRNQIKEHPDFNAKRCFPFVCDLAAESWDVPFKEDSLDYIILIFVLSAIHPEKMPTILDKLVKYLKPGGQILFRDYGRYDMVQLRFKPGQCLTDHFYVRGDGTRVYFFTEDEVDNLMTSAGIDKVQLYSSKRLQVNRGKQLKMFRIWIQAKYKKPLM